MDQKNIAWQGLYLYNGYLENIQTCYGLFSVCSLFLRGIVAVSS